MLPKFVTGHIEWLLIICVTRVAGRAPAYSLRRQSVYEKKCKQISRARILNYFVFVRFRQQPIPLVGRYYLLYYIIIILYVRLFVLFISFFSNSEKGYRTQQPRSGCHRRDIRGRIVLFSAPYNRTSVKQYIIINVYTYILLYTRGRVVVLLLPSRFEWDNNSNSKKSVIKHAALIETTLISRLDSYSGCRYIMCENRSATSVVGVQSLCTHWSVFAQACRLGFDAIEQFKSRKVFTDAG